MKFFFPLLVFLLVGAAGAPAQENDQRDRIAAATANAVDSLRKQIGDSSIARTLTVKQLLDRVGGQDELTKVLARAAQIGGPRWLDDQTLQVRLEIPGSSVADALKRIVSDNPAKSPVSAEFVSTRLRDWDHRTFSATGTSTASNAVESIRPMPERGSWACIGEQARKKAVVAARADAVAKVLEAIKPIPLTQGKTVGDMLAVASVRERIEKWLGTRPIARVEFGNDRDVKLTLSVPSEELFAIFAQAAHDQKTVAIPRDDAAWDAVKQQFAARVVKVVGRATASAPATVPAGYAIQIPATAPDWVNRQLDAEGAAKSKTSRLKAARAAESDAIAKLKAQIDGLPLTSGMTLRQAGERDGRIADTVQHAIEQARTYKVDYDPEGGAKVRVSVDLRELWEQLRSPP